MVEGGGVRTNRSATASLLWIGWRAVDLNSDVDDDDGIPNLRETAAGTNPYSNDSDADGVLDRIEWDWNRDTDLENVLGLVVLGC